MRTVLLAIDVQYDFCHPNGALYVKGATDDMKNISRLIENNIPNLDGIIFSMDSHQPVHIAHQIYWKDANSEHPNLFSTITKYDVENRLWLPQYNQDHALNYLQNLEAAGGVCTIWPPHCIIGTKGWCLDETVFASVTKWATTTGRSYSLVNKGMEQATEHYSIFKAAVEYPNIPATLFNEPLLDELKTYDQILIVGEAADFCVASSLKDLLDRAPHLGRKICLLTDCMSYIIPDSDFAKGVFARANELGVRFMISSEL